MSVSKDRMRLSARRGDAGREDLPTATALGDREPGEDLIQRQDRLLDEAVEETFPASDSITPKRIV